MIFVLVERCFTDITIDYFVEGKSTTMKIHDRLSTTFGFHIFECIIRASPFYTHVLLQSSRYRMGHLHPGRAYIHRLHLQ